jgi:signal transduction histidine kinase/DNA-binding response OmpR family regulator
MAKVLVVDDRPTNRQFLLTLLGYAGHELLEAADGTEALRRAHADHPDLIITDILMPIMSGYEFVQHLRADALLSATPVIFYTASYSEPQAMQLAQACDVRIVLPKPCDPERVLAAVNEALHIDQPQQLTPAAHERVAVVAKEAMLAENMLAGYLRDLNTAKQTFLEIADQHVQPPFEPAMLQELSATFSKTIAGLSLMASRLSALVQAGVDLLHERDSHAVVRHCFDAACGVVGSTYAAIGVFDAQETQLRFVFTKGIDARVYTGNSGREISWIAALLEQKRIVRTNAAVGDKLGGFPAGHPPLENFLGVPIATADQVYGWLYFGDRLGATEFTDEDERVAATLALQLALLHENFMLYDTLQNHAVQLQLEMAERRNAERELLRLNETLEARVAERTAELRLANKELEAFSYSVSHDLRAPLTTIAGFVRLLLQPQSPSSGAAAEQQSYLQYIDAGTQRAMSIIDALLRLAQLNRQSLDKRRVDVTALVAEVVVQLRAQLSDRLIDIEVSTLPDCIGDADMLKQVFVNLLANAIKFTRRQVNAKITIGSHLQQGERIYFVTDNGVGFNPRHAERLFTAFQRDHSEAQFEGTGIGLSIVQRIVQRHAGRVWAESTPSQGATFYFTLG